MSEHTEPKNHYHRHTRELFHTHEHSHGRPKDDESKHTHGHIHRRVLKDFAVGKPRRQC